MTTRHGFFFGLALGLMFSLGFGAAVLVAPRAEAQTSPPGQRWEYTTTEHGFDHGRWANEMGQRGWRFIGFDGNNSHVQIFERPAR